jgi:hypothetical protein
MPPPPWRPSVRDDGGTVEEAYSQRGLRWAGAGREEAQRPGGGLRWRPVGLAANLGRCGRWGCGESKAEETNGTMQPVNAGGRPGGGGEGM